MFVKWLGILSKINRFYVRMRHDTYILFCLVCTCLILCEIMVQNSRNFSGVVSPPHGPVFFGFLEHTDPVWHVSNPACSIAPSCGFCIPSCWLISLPLWAPSQPFIACCAIFNWITIIMLLIIIIIKCVIDFSLLVEDLFGISLNCISNIWNYAAYYEPFEAS